MNFSNPRFLRSGWNADGISERIIVFAGRSNAGKSSAINALCGGRFARAAKTPGRTRMINLFALSNGYVLADLPGYGYAAGPRTDSDSWGAHITEFLHAPQIGGAVLVIDCRRGLQQKDGALLALVAGLPTLILINKTDKLGRAELHRQKQTIQTAVRDLPLVCTQIFSARTKIGVPEARIAIANMLTPSIMGYNNGAQLCNTAK